MLDRLQAAFEGQQRFIANASHELRTPLAVMRATVDVVLDNPDSTPADLRDMATDIRAAVDHAEHLIGALLILARNERGLTIHEQVDLATIAEDVLDTADLGDRHVHATLEPAVISGDPVLAERLDREPRRQRSPLQRRRRRHLDQHPHRRRASSQLTVANTGPPVSPADADRIFQPFQRLNDRASHDGFGLGPHHRRVHRRSPRRHRHRPPPRRRRPVHHRHNPLGRVPRPRHGQAGDRTSRGRANRSPDLRQIHTWWACDSVRSRCR